MCWINNCWSQWISNSVFISHFLRYGRRLSVLWIQTPQTAALCTSTMLLWLHFPLASAGTTALLLHTSCHVLFVPAFQEGTTAALWSVSLTFTKIPFLWIDADHCHAVVILNFKLSVKCCSWFQKIFSIVLVYWYLCHYRSKKNNWQFDRHEHLFLF